MSELTRESRYDDPAYQKQVSLQLLATPTHEIACRAITDLRARLEAVEGERDKLVKRCDEKSECISNDTNRFIVVTHRIKELCPEATSLENGIERLQQLLAAAEGRVQDNNDLVHILSNHCGESGVSEGAVKTLNRIIAERDRLAGSLSYIQTWKGCTFRVGDFDSETDTYPIYQQCGITNCGTIAEFYGKTAAEWFAALLNHALTPAAAQEGLSK